MAGDILMMGDIPLVEGVVAAPRRIHRLWEQSDASAFLDETGGDIVLLVACQLFGEVDEDMLNRLPNLEAIVSRGIGYDQIDVAAALRRGIVISNTPAGVAVDTAELAMGLMIAAARGITANDRHVREGRWPTEGKGPRPGRLSGRRLGILGMGRIGMAAAQRAEAFGLTIAYHNRRPRSDLPYPYEADLLNLAARSDILLVTAAGGPDTHHLVNRDVLRALGPGGLVVNVARGSIIDESALVAVLDRGEIAGAALDVFENEPYPSAALLAFPNVVLQSHRGGYTDEGRAELDRQTLDNIASYLTAGRLLNPIPEMHAAPAMR